MNKEVMVRGNHSTGSRDKTTFEAEFLSRREKEMMEAYEEQPDCDNEFEDSDSLASERLLSTGYKAEGQALSFGVAWDLAFYGEDCFSEEVIQYALNLAQHSGSPCLDEKVQEIQQQLIIETRNLKKTRNFYKKLIQQKKNKVCDNKRMLSKLKLQLEELKSKVNFLNRVKKYLEILSMEQWGVEVSMLPYLAICRFDLVDHQPSKDITLLSLVISKGKSNLQTGSLLDLMAYLYARHAVIEGYIQQFLYTYRFLCTPEELLKFIMEKFINAAREDPDMSAVNEKIFHRSLDLLHFWITDCKSVDFTPKSILVEMLESFLHTEVIPVHRQGKVLLAALHSSPSQSPVRGSLHSFDEEDSLCLSTEDLDKKWKISGVVEPSGALPKDKTYSIAEALPKPCYESLIENLTNVCLQNEEQIPFSQSEYSTQQTAQQLTLLQQEMFQGCHPVHFLNSRTQGVKDNVMAVRKNVSQSVPVLERSSEEGNEGKEGRLQQLLSYADKVSDWIACEIVICDSVKSQVALLTKYLWIGKHCYEWRNFATAMQVLEGLDNGIVRQLPAWEHVPSKVCEILEELRAVQVFLKSDDLCLMGGEHVRKRATLPAAHILAMHVQQLEIGAFTLTTGAYKWTKLRSIAKVVSQVHAFQEVTYSFTPIWQLQAYLRCRIYRLAESELGLTSENNSRFQQSSERQTRRIQDMLKRVKATFQ